MFRIIALLVFLPLPLFAAQRQFVASYGNDANPCTLMQPCRGFVAAISLVDFGGEVIVLDSAGYGSMTISKSLSIVTPPGVYAGISVSSGVGVTVDVPPNAVVNLRGLRITGAGGTGGIALTAQGALSTLRIEDCIVSGVAGDGVSVQALANVYVTTSDIQDNGGNGVVQSNNASLTVQGSRILGNAGPGIRIESGSANIAQTIVARNGQYGIYAATFGPITIIDSSVMDTNGEGVHFNGAEGHVVNSLLRGNFNAGISAAAGSRLSVTHSIVDSNLGYGIVVTDQAASISGSTVDGNIAGGILGISDQLPMVLNVVETTLSGNVSAGVLVSAAFAGSKATAVMSRITATHNAGVGIAVQVLPGGGTATASITQVTSSANTGRGFSVGGIGARMTVVDSTASSNAQEGLVQQDGALLYTRGNNTLNDNNHGGAQTSGVLSQLGPI